MSLQVVPAPGGAAVTAGGEIRHLCPFVDEVDRGAVTVEWRTRTHTIELHSLAQYLTTWADLRISHEDLAETITRHLSQLDGIEDVTVSLRFTTAGLDCTVKAGR